MPPDFHPFLWEQERQWTEEEKSKRKKLVAWAQKMGLELREHPQGEKWQPPWRT